jgi:FkbM family methyltransferase
MQHLHINKCTNTCVYQMVIAEKKQVMSFKVGHTSSTGTIQNNKKTREGYDYFIPSYSLDDLISDGYAPIPDMIKMDVEGAESRILEGAQNLLCHNNVTLFVSLHGEEQKDTCLRLLQEYGYSVSDLHGHSVVLGGDVLIPEDIVAIKKNRG